MNAEADEQATERAMSIWNLEFDDPVLEKVGKKGAGLGLASCSSCVAPGTVAAVLRRRFNHARGSGEVGAHLRGHYFSHLLVGLLVWWFVRLFVCLFVCLFVPSFVCLLLIVCLFLR